MTSLRRSLPSLAALSTFEAAARLGSFTQAAAELGVTQAAVSRQIKLLEQDLNTSLFTRAHKRVVLTPPGTALAATVSLSFTNMAEMIDTIRRPASSDTVAVAATLGFTHFWILPRLAEFRETHPQIKLKLVAEDGITDLRRDRLDVAIRYGRAPFPQATSLASRADRVFPVCSPALRDKLSLGDAPDLARLPLIASDTVNPSWLTWRSWAQRVGLGGDLGRASDRSGLRFNHYTDSIHAAVNGEGVALGWETLISSHLAEGRLIPLGQHSLTTEERYHVIIPADSVPTPQAQAFLDWLIARLNG
ncbi:MAG: LysR substrate-binding domain-containing protein [Paracoccus sp. (in: a-proteobacteria)]|uniref:LysR substrate-binding domain-containing protein n=1 Tax=Paracoccus sp. TaxID=267 RepID=UPI0026DEF673|nr:LysR substrate-binding domain-containing protein [Paracoccus sp. (in: a-proteobacteria)]MDO5614018.1 LysR substrate-binding domain-containing protein [Paracoccus sp. (in: a-proteobacteria)]